MTPAAAALARHGPREALTAYLAEVRGLVLEEIAGIVPNDDSHTGGLYELMLDYPLRGGKGLRPALCVATCQALGGSLSGVLPSAAVLELYHNAFLIHDDVEDGSEKRRREDTLHRVHGVPIAVNVGDGMLALTLRPLLDNTRHLGLGRALRVLEAVAEMARESAEGQMLELDWIRRLDWTADDRAYFRMVHKKSAWYSFVTPVTVGAIAAGAAPTLLARLRRFATLLGVAFQIQDDVLNLLGEEARYGKEIAGDLWEGKHTLILIHAVRSASAGERRRARQILRKPRQGAVSERGRLAVLRRRIERLAEAGELSLRARRSLLRTVSDSLRACEARSRQEVAFLRDLIDRHGSLDYAWAAAQRRSERAARSLAEIARDLPRSRHVGFLEDVADYVVTRDR
jgi:geranylgeranyl diphosphate synthase type II